MLNSYWIIYNTTQCDAEWLTVISFWIKKIVIETLNDKLIQNIVGNINLTRREEIDFKIVHSLKEIFTFR